MERFDIHSDTFVVFTNSSYFTVKKRDELWAVLLVIST